MKEVKRIVKRMKKGTLASGRGRTEHWIVCLQVGFFEVAKQMEIYTTLFKELNMHYIDEINSAQLTESAINNMLEERPHGPLL